MSTHKKPVKKYENYMAQNSLLCKVLQMLGMRGL